MKAQVPAEPIRRIVEKWLAEREAEFNRDEALARSRHGNTYVEMSPLMQLVYRIWDVTDSHDPKLRIVYRLLDRRSGRKPTNKAGRTGEPHMQENISFENADLILTKLDLNHLWWEDAELRDAYMKVDLAHLDSTKPCTREFAEAA